MGRCADWNNSCDPPVLQDLLQAGLLVAKREFVDKRRDDGFVTLRRNRGHVVPDDRIGERGRIWTRKQGIDYGGPLCASRGKQFFHLWNRGYATWPPLLVASLLDQVDDEDRSGLRIK